MKDYWIENDSWWNSAVKHYKERRLSTYIKWRASEV